MARQAASLRRTTPSVCGRSRATAAFAPCKP